MEKSEQPSAFGLEALAKSLAAQARTDATLRATRIALLVLTVVFLAACFEEPMPEKLLPEEPQAEPTATPIPTATITATPHPQLPTIPPVEGPIKLPGHLPRPIKPWYVVSVHAPTIDHVFKVYDDGWDGFHGLKAGDTGTGLLHIYFHPGVVFANNPELEWDYMRYYAHIAREEWRKAHERHSLEGRHDLHLLFFANWSDVAHFSRQPSREQGNILIGTNVAIINHGFEGNLYGDTRTNIKSYIKNAVGVLAQRIEMTTPAPRPTLVPTMAPTAAPPESGLQAGGSGGKGLPTMAPTPVPVERK